MKYYHSQAFKIHKALPESRYIFNIDMEDQIPEKDEDIYRVEVSQKNGQWAAVHRFLSEMYKNKNNFYSRKVT